jgi:hypothetical protein
MLIIISKMCCARGSRLRVGIKTIRAACIASTLASIVVSGSFRISACLLAIFDLEITLISNEERHSGRSLLCRLFEA